MPFKERRFELDSSFGADSLETQTAKEVMQKTGCNIEVHHAKDGSLSIMVTGRPKAVLQAKKLILNQLQTQVCMSLVLLYTLKRLYYGHLGTRPCP